MKRHIGSLFENQSTNEPSGDIIFNRSQPLPSPPPGRVVEPLSVVEKRSREDQQNRENRHSLDQQIMIDEIDVDDESIQDNENSNETLTNEVNYFLTPHQPAYQFFCDVLEDVGISYEKNANDKRVKEFELAELLFTSIDYNSFKHFAVVKKFVPDSLKPGEKKGFHLMVMDKKSNTLFSKDSRQMCFLLYGIISFKSAFKQFSVILQRESIFDDNYVFGKYINIVDNKSFSYMDTNVHLPDKSCCEQVQYTYDSIIRFNTKVGDARPATCKKVKWQTKDATFLETLVNKNVFVIIEGLVASLSTKETIGPKTIYLKGSKLISVLYPHSQNL